MQAAATESAVKRVMETYGWLERLSIEEERTLRQRVTAHLAKCQTTDETQLAVEGIKFLKAARSDNA